MTTLTELRRLVDNVGTHTTLNDWKEIHDTFDEAIAGADRYHRVLVGMYVDANHKYLASR